MPVLVAVWCRSVGATWTLELHEPDPGTTLGTIMYWISSGVPTTQPKPDQAVARELLADRGLHLYPDSTAGPSTASRPSIGYVSGDIEVIDLAHRIRDAAAAAGVHPVVLAAQRIAARCGVHVSRVQARDGQGSGQTLRM